MKSILILSVALASALWVAAQDNSTETNAPSLVVTTKQVVTVEPLVLTPEQMTAIIGGVVSNGISANAPISTDNLKSVYVYKRPDGSFVVNIQLDQP